MSDASFWDHAPRGPDDARIWANEPLVRRLVLEAVSGHPNVDFFTYLVSRHLREPAPRGLVLGCGRATIEQQLVVTGACAEVDAIDLSVESIREASDATARAGLASRIHYTRADLNDYRLPKAAYSLVVSFGALHHIEKLEHLLAEIESSMTPGALLIVDEFVGPSRFQWTTLQLEIANLFLERAWPTSSYVGPSVRPSAEYLAAVDPTESVRSHDLLPLVLERFDAIERHDYGGTILNLVLGQPILTSSNSVGHQTALRVFYALERALIRERLLPSDWVLLALRRRT